MGVTPSATTNTKCGQTTLYFERRLVSASCTADGKAKATVTPDGAPPSFFLRVKVR